MPTWIISILRPWLLNKATSSLAEEIKKADPAIVPALKKFDEGASFMEMIAAYVAATENTDDDQVIADLTTKPFKEVLPLLAGPIGAIHIPDGDGDPTNDITIGEVLERIKAKIVE